MANEKVSEQVAALEAERDALKVERDEWQKEALGRGELAEIRARNLAVLESRVSGAAREGARSALTSMANNIHVTHEEHARICEWRDINFPAVPAEVERTRTDAKCDKCWLDRDWNVPCVCPAPTPARKPSVPKVIGFAGGKLWQNEAGNWCWERPYGDKRHGVSTMRNWESLPDLLASIAESAPDKPTTDEYAALLSLRDGGE